MLTVAIMSYRYGHLAAHCIETILSQTVKPERIIFVDDGAGDCFHLRNIYQDIEYIFRPLNLGIIDNFNDVLYKINSEYTMFLGADNWLRSDSIEKLLQYETDIITYDICVTGECKDDLIKRGHSHELCPMNGDMYWTRKDSHHGSMMYRTKLAQQFGYKRNIPNNHYTEEDWNLFLNMRNAGASLAHHAESLLYYRRHKSNYFKY